MKRPSRHLHHNQPTLSGAPSETGQVELVAHSITEKTENSFLRKIQEKVSG